MPARPLAVLLTAAALALGPVLAAPAPAAAARVPATVTVDSLEPTSLTEGSELRVAGRLANTGRQELRDVEVRLRLSSTRLGSRTELASVMAGDTTSRDGDVVADASLPDLGVGQQTTFTLARDVADLDALTGFGVHVLGIEVLATREGGFGRVALVRTLMPWLPAGEEVVPTRLSWVWPLVGRPTRLADGTFADDSLATDLGADGRLTRLLDAGVRLAQTQALTWAIDPDLVSTIADMADGYDVTGPDGAPVPGGASALAARWLESLRTATAGEAVLGLPYGDVDLTALVRADLGDDFAEGLGAARTTLTEALPGADVMVDAAWPVDGYAGRPALAALHRAEVRTVILDGRAVPPEIDLRYTPTGRAHVPTSAGRLAGVLADPALADLLRGQHRKGTDPGLAAQRVLAETAMIASELPSGPARAVLLMPPRRFDPDPAFLDRLVGGAAAARWLEPVSLRQFADTPPPEVDRAPLDYPRAQRAGELSPAYLKALESMHEGVAVFAAILTDTSAYVPGLDRSMLRLESSWWRGRDARANRLARESAYLAELRGAVRVQPGNFTFSSRRGTLALTVANGLDQEVRVSLRLEPQTPRLRLEPVKLAPIGPESKVQVEVAATAVAPGPVLVDASLRTVGGTPYGQPVKLRITITEYGTVALYITIGAGAVLIMAAAVRVLRRVLAARRRTETPVAAP